MCEKTPATFKNLLDKDGVKGQSLDLEHFVVGIDNENRDVNKEERKKIDTNANKDSKLQCHTMVDEDHVVVQSNIQEKFVEEASLGKPGTVNNKFEVVQNEQKVLSTAERLVKDQRSCANSKKNIFKHDEKPDEQHTDRIDEMDAPFGTREPLNLRFADYRESVILEPPVTSFDTLFNGGMNLLQEDVTINNNSDLENCSAEVVENGKNLHETRLNENDRLIDHAVNSEVIHKSSFGPREMELSEDAKSKAESCSYVDEENHSDLQDLIVRHGIRANKLKLFRDSVRRLERPLSVFAVIVSVLLFMADIVTDCLLAGEYYNEAKMELFYATAVFIIGPAVILSMVDLSWLYIDIKKRQSSDPGSYEWTNRQWIFTFRVLLGVFSLGRIVRCVQYIYHYLKFTKIIKSETGKKRRERFYQKSRAKEERRDFYMLDFINVFTESGLQLMVQLFLFFQYDLKLDIIRVSSLFTSWISIAWTLVSYYTYNRDAISRKQAPTLIGICVCFIARACELAARIIAIALFVTIFHFWGFLLVFHFLAMLLWLGIFSRPKLDDIASTMFGKVLYTILYAFVLIFCFINLEEKQTFKRMLVFYLVLYLESFAMAVLVFIHLLEQDGIHSYKIQSLIIVPLGCGIHLMAQTIYYVCCHPTVREKYQCSHCMACR